MHILDSRPDEGSDVVSGMTKRLRCHHFLNSETSHISLHEAHVNYEDSCPLQSRYIFTWAHFSERETQKPKQSQTA